MEFLIKTIENHLIDKEININSVVFFFACMFLGLFSGVLMAYNRFLLMESMMFFSIFTGGNFIFPITLFFFQFLGVILSFAKNGIAFIFSGIDLLEIIILYFIYKKHKFNQYIIDLKFFSSFLCMCFVLIIFAILLLRENFYFLQMSSLSQINMPMVFTTQKDSLIEGLKMVCFSTFDNFHIQHFSDIFHIANKLLQITFVRTFIVIFSFGRFLQFNDVEIIKSRPRTFYYVGLLFSLILFIYSLYSKLFFATLVSFNLCAMFMCVFIAFTALYILSPYSSIFVWLVFSVFYEANSIAFLVLCFLFSLLIPFFDNWNNEK